MWADIIPVNSGGAQANAEISVAQGAVAANAHDSRADERALIGDTACACGVGSVAVAVVRILIVVRVRCHKIFVVLN